MSARQRPLITLRQLLSGRDANLHPAVLLRVELENICQHQLLCIPLWESFAANYEDIHPFACNSCCMHARMITVLLSCPGCISELLGIDVAVAPMIRPRHDQTTHLLPLISAS